MTHIARYLPILDWGRRYDRTVLASDLVAAIIVTVMLIPQSLAYAMLAGLPPEVGLYASVLPLIAYGIFGTSRTLAVGPVAVISLMTASAIGQIAAEGSADYLSAAIVLALLSGGMLLLMGLLRLGFIANFLSHPVISGFISASGILIAASQMKHVLGVPAEGDTLVEIVTSLVAYRGDMNIYTIAIGAGSIAFLYFSRTALKPLLTGIGLPERLADLLSRAAPVAIVAVTILLAIGFDLGGKGVHLIGEIPQGLPVPGLPAISLDLVSALAAPAFLISIIGFVESVSVGQTLAARRRQRIVPDQELIGLGIANIASGFSSGYPVTGGFARSVVNFDAGAETPAAGMFTAIGIALVTLFLTPLLANLPQATLAATIIVAVLSLVDLKAIRNVFGYSMTDFSAMAATILVTLLAGVEPGVMAGVGLSLLLHLYRTSRPHLAIVGQVPGTEHFRNVNRYQVLTDPKVLSIRVDESLYFANSRYLEDHITALMADQPEVAHVVLMCSAVNDIDASALESLEEINRRLKDAEIRFHLSEVKGPVIDRLKRTSFLDRLTGSVFLSQFEAATSLGMPSVITGPLKGG